jgi:hypothetical protein
MQADTYRFDKTRTLPDFPVIDGNDSSSYALANDGYCTKWEQELNYEEHLEVLSSNDKGSKQRAKSSTSVTSIYNSELGARKCCIPVSNIKLRVEMLSNDVN